MTSSQLGETTPSSPPPPDSQDQDESSRPRRGRTLLIGLVAFIVIAGLGGLGGYQTAIADRVAAATLETAVEISKQFLRAQQDYVDGNYDVARDRIEYVISKDPGYPGAEALLTQILIASQSTATPTVAPTPTLTPTADLRDIQQIFESAQRNRVDEHWDLMLENLDSIRKLDPTYRSIEIDGLYYVAYRERGIYRIQVEGNLEGGIFDLDRAMLFGPLDVEAQNYREWASWYITGASFWDLDWSQVVTYFGDIVLSVPNLRDTSGFTASDRLATAQVEYSFDLILQGDLLLSQKEWCEADEAYQQANLYAPLDPTAQPTAQFASEKCRLEESDN